MLWVLLDRERRLEENLSASPFDLRRVLREVLIVPETKPAGELLLELRTHHVGWRLSSMNSAAFSVSSLGDILEQVVGEIHDEFDVVERPLTLADGAIVFDAAVECRDLDTQYNITLPEDPPTRLSAVSSSINSDSFRAGGESLNSETIASR